MERKSSVADLLYRLALIHEAETIIICDYGQDQMRTPMHMSRGQTLAAVGVLTKLQNAHVFCSYRSHAAFLAGTLDLDAFWSEMLGYEEGPNYGEAGSMHIADPGQRHHLSSGIVAGQIAPAVGYAMALRMRKIDEPVVVFLGDGATNEGAFWECLNLAAVYDLRIVFVVEDNGKAVNTAQDKRQAYSLIGAFQAMKYPVQEVQPYDLLSIYSSVMLDMDAMPSGLIVKCFREMEHVGVSENCTRTRLSTNVFDEMVAQLGGDLGKEKVDEILTQARDRAVWSYRRVLERARK